MYYKTAQSGARRLLEQNQVAFRHSPAPYLVRGPVLHQKLHLLHDRRNIVHGAQVEKRLWARRKVRNVGGANDYRHGARLQHVVELLGDVVGPLTIFKRQVKEVGACNSNFLTVARPVTCLVSGVVVGGCKKGTGGVSLW